MERERKNNEQNNMKVIHVIIFFMTIKLTDYREMLQQSNIWYHYSIDQQWRRAVTNLKLWIKNKIIYNDFYELVIRFWFKVDYSFTIMPYDGLVSLNMLCIMFKIIAFFIMMSLAWLYVRVGVLLTCGEHMYDSIILIRR